MLILLLKKHLKNVFYIMEGKRGPQLKFLATQLFVLAKHSITT